LLLHLLGQILGPFLRLLVVVLRDLRDGLLGLRRWPWALDIALVPSN